MPKILRSLLLATAVLMTLAGTTATASAAGWQYFQTDGDHFYDIAGIDRNGNGAIDDAYFDLDNDGPYDANLYNTRYDETILEVLDIDMDENDRVEIRLLDGDQRLGFDYIQVDRDQNGAWDRVRGYTRQIIPGSNVDNVNRHNRQNASMNLIHNFRQQTGMSLLFPSLPMPY